MSEGQYRLQFYVLEGPYKGTRSSATLWLRSTAGSRRYFSGSKRAKRAQEVELLYGAVRFDDDVSSPDLCPLGYTRDRCGEIDPASCDPRLPGALVVGFPGRVELILAAHQNQFERTILDGGGLFVDVYKITPDGFSGMWPLLAMQGRGYGCFTARKVDSQLGPCAHSEDLGVKKPRR